MRGLVPDLREFLLRVAALIEASDAGHGQRAAVPAAASSLLLGVGAVPLLVIAHTLLSLAARVFL
jgi:hypothetical protein